MAFDGDPLPANELRQKAVWGQWRADVHATTYIIAISHWIYVYPIKVCVCVCACRTASLVSEKCTNRSPTSKFIEQLRPRTSYFALTDVSVTVSNNARLNSASVGSQASAASGSWRTEGWNPRMIWLMVENPISIPMMGFWTFQVVTWISAINIRHPWFVSSLIHKMPTPPPEVSCASGGLLQPQLLDQGRWHCFNFQKRSTNQKMKTATYIQHTWLEMHLNANLWKSHHANHISCTTHTSLGRCNFRKQAKNKRNTQTHKKNL